MVGSEGTLGVITEVRLRPRREPERTIAGYFDSVIAAGEAVSAVFASGVIPSALELVDRHFLEAVDAWKKMGLSTEANVVLLGRVDTPGHAGEEEARTILRCFEETGATWAALSTDEHEAEALFDARRWRTPHWSGSARCSPRTCACRGRWCRRCWRGSKRLPPGTTR